MSNQVKLLRGQLRQIVMEMLPDIIKHHGFLELKKDIDKRLDAIEKHLKSVTELMDNRQKDTMSLLIRQIGEAQSKSMKKE